MSIFLRTWISLTNALFGSLPWILHLFSSIYDRSEGLPAPDMFLRKLPLLTALRLAISLTCCRFRGIWANPTEDCRPPSLSAIACWTAYLAFISPATIFRWSFVLSQVRTKGVFFFLELPRGFFGMGCSWPLLKEYCTKKYLCSCPPSTITK